MTSSPETVEIATVVRTLRFEVTWPGWRRADRLALWEELWRAQDDLRRAANRAISLLYQIRIGALPQPMHDGRPVPERSLCYQLLSGSGTWHRTGPWAAHGIPFYVPSDGTRQVGSAVLNDLANTIATRAKKDFPLVRRGERSLPTWRTVAIGASDQAITVDRETGGITIPLWEGRGQRVTLRPRKLDPRLWGDLRRALKAGPARLQWDAPPGRKGRWMLSLSVDVPAALPKPERELVCAVRLGVQTTCTLAYADPATKVVERRCDVVDLPASAWRAAQRVERERRERGQWNRLDHGQREGRGRARKLRAVEGLGDVVQRVADTAVRQTAAAVVAMAVQRGATTIALPALSGWLTAHVLDVTEDVAPHAERARRRKGYFQAHWGALIAQITQVAERRGLRVVEVSAAGSGSECSECGKEGERIEGRFRCSCGCALPVAANTAKVLARRALAE